MQLSSRAVDAIKCGNKLEAIKIIREESTLGLKEAKALVDDYLSTHPDLKAALKQKQVTALSLSNIALIVIVICAAIAAYYLLRHP